MARNIFLFIALKQNIRQEINCWTKASLIDLQLLRFKVACIHRDTAMLRLSVHLVRGYLTLRLTIYGFHSRTFSAPKDTLLSFLRTNLFSAPIFFRYEFDSTFIMLSTQNYLIYSNEYFQSFVVSQKEFRYVIKQIAMVEQYYLFCNIEPKACLQKDLFYN